MWLNDLFWGIRNTFVEYHFLVINDHLRGPSVHVNKSSKRIQAWVRPPSPIQAMPIFWEHLVLQPLPKTISEIELH